MAAPGVSRQLPQLRGKMAPAFAPALALLAAAAVLRPAAGRVVTGSTVLTGEVTEQELCKFAYRVGRGSFKLWAWVEAGARYQSRELTAYAYLDEQWPAMLAATTCEEKVKLARWAAPVAFDGAPGDAGGAWRPPAGARAWSMRRAMTSSIRTHVWYFTLADCSLERFYHEVPAVHYRAELLDGDSHLPVDEAGLGWLHAANVAAAAAVVAWLAARARGARAVHAATLGLGGAAALDALSSLFELAHVGSYAADGVGSYAADALAAYCEAACDGVLSALVLCVAAGWTAGGHLGDDEKAGRGPLAAETLAERAASAAAPVAAALRRPLAPGSRVAAAAAAWTAAHVALAQWSRVYDDDFDVFHDFEHAPGRAVVALRVALLAVFLPVALRTQACAGGRLRRFYVLWATLGGAWLLSLPAICLVARSLPAYYRHRVVSGATAAVQTAALACLALLFTGRAGRAFREASSVAGGGEDLGLPRGGGGDDAPRGAAKLRLGPLKVRTD